MALCRGCLGPPFQFARPWTLMDALHIFKLFKTAGLSLQSKYNRVRVPGHNGAHGKFYNSLILERLQRQVSGHTGASRQSALISELKLIRREIKHGDLGDLLRAPASRTDVMGMF